jgi:hypothetical protein
LQDYIFQSYLLYAPYHVTTKYKPIDIYVNLRTTLYVHDLVLMNLFSSYIYLKYWNQSYCFVVLINVPFR